MEPSDYPSVDMKNQGRLRFDHVIKRTEWNPIGTYNQQIGSGDVVRFMPSSKDAWWDPYSAYIELTVDVNNNLMLDDDADQINKCLQLDGSAHSFFKQLIIYHNSTELERLQHYDILMANLKDISTSVDERYSKDYEGFGGTYSSSYFNPTMRAAFGARLNDGILKGVQGYKPYHDNQLYTDDNSSVNVRNNGGTETTTSHIYNYSQSGFEPFMNATDILYSGNVADARRNYNETQQVYYIWSYLDGLLQPYSPAFSNSGMEPVFSKKLKQRFLRNGFITTETITQHTFRIPLFSGIFGIGMHPKNYKLIPMKYFENLTFEFQFNEHALFSSFYNSSAAARNYNVSRLVMIVDMVEIKDPAILSNLESDFQRGIKIPTTSWYLGPLQNVTAGAIPPTTQINLGFNSLRQIMFCFIPNDYTANSAYRKQYRLSMAVTSMQAKIGTDFYPPLPIRGNAGNNLGTINNYGFVQETLKCFHKQFSGTSFINPHNFAINCRPFDHTKTDDATRKTQWSYFEENRIIGKAIFALNFESLNYENDLLPGVDTTKTRPFELGLQYDGTRVFPRNVTMYSFCHYDLVLSIGPDGIKSLGRVA